MDKPLIIANWKCNPTTFNEAKLLFNSVKEGLRNIRNIEVVICPPFVYLLSFKLSGKTSQKNIKLGAQDCFWEEMGAFTGEISPLMLKNLNCRYVIVGHSERRRYFQETDEIINKKVKEVISENLIPILCIGETKEEKEKGDTPKKLEFQIKRDLVGISKEKIKNIIIAYEPIWAIGTKNPCPPEETYAVSLLIKKIINKSSGSVPSKKVRILYGGSVNSGNVSGLIKEAGVSGLLIGSASLSAQEFIKIIKRVSKD